MFNYNGIAFCTWLENLDIDETERLKMKALVNVVLNLKTKLNILFNPF